jgi:putative transposase
MEHTSDVRQRRGERGIWQRPYWVHLICDEANFRAHLDYVHINPVKHGLVQSVAEIELTTNTAEFNWSLFGCGVVGNEY